MKRFNQVKKYGRQIVAAAGTGLTMLATNAHAALSTTGAETAITAAQSSAEGVGGLVVAAVAGIAAIGVVIAVVRKI